MKFNGKTGIIFVIILLVYCLYAGLFIYKTSFVIDGRRYFSLFDDAMISMRYAKNLSQGHGPVWNPGGERVEGFTNPLWVLYMAVFHLFPIAASKISLFIQISGALFLIINLLFVKKIADLLFGPSAFFGLAAVLLTAFYLPLNNWSLQGMEVGVLTLLIGMSVWTALRAIRGDKFSLWPFTLLGLGTLVRMDMAVPYLAVWLFLIFAGADQRRKNLLWGGAILLAFLSAQTLFRIAYYGEVLPNTYYLKITGYPLLLRITRGLAVTGEFITRMNVILFLLPFVLLLFCRDKPMFLLLGIFLAQIAYSIYAGGDAWEYWGGSNRYVSVVMPLFFILFCGSLAEIEARLVESRQKSGKPIRVWARFITVVVLLIGLVRFNIIYSPYGTLQEWLLLKRPLAVADNEEMVRRALLLKKITEPDARVAVVWAGALGYFSDRPIIDLLGKNDKRIARQKTRVSTGPDKYTAFYPGHMKWNYDYSIGERNPDVIAQLYGVAREEIEPYLAADYEKVIIGDFVFHLRRDSQQILWEKVDDLRL